MKSNKLFLILLSLVLSVTLLVACTQDEKPSDGESDTAPSETNASTDTADTADEDTALVMTVTQREYARSLCKRGIVLYKGKVVFDGPFGEALEYYDANVKSKLKQSDSGIEDQSKVSD